MAPAIVALIWFGMLIGVSFVATPVKFVVQDLSLATALQVGQATFGLFTKIEWGLVAALFATSTPEWRTRPLVLALALALGASVIVQATWLLPALDVRVATIVAGQTPPPSWHHAIYAGVEAAKALALSMLALCPPRRLSQFGSANSATHVP